MSFGTLGNRNMGQILFGRFILTLLKRTHNDLGCVAMIPFSRPVACLSSLFYICVFYLLSEIVLHILVVNNQHSLGREIIQSKTFQ